MTKNNFIFWLFSPLWILAFYCCEPTNTSNQSTEENADRNVYLNHADSAKYVGMATCRLCHQGIYNTFIKTGMGKSFDIASKIKSAAEFKNAEVYDKLADLHYRAFWAHDSLFVKEFRIIKKDTTHNRVEQVNYIVGSGQHTNSHLHIENGYLNQMPMTFYTQKKQWDLPPGFENGLNTRFSRKIGLECLSCHNAYPDFVLGSENKFKQVPLGIDCERCHGPGSIHVAQRQTGSKVDTSKFIDYSIVNPAKLTIDAQFDVCQRCHLQGNAVLKTGKSFFDFKPGQKLADYISVFLPKFKNADQDFIMASHADRLKQSPCFIKSYQKVEQKNKLKPYQGALTCVTCHNPHVSVKETNKNVFNEACVNCHQTITTPAKIQKQLQKAGCGLHSFKITNCVGCHMPVSGAIDIPHVTVHDHYIRKPITNEEKNKIKTFLGLFAINEKNPDNLTRAKAYINQYDKFEQNKSYLDSAANLLASEKDLQKNIHALLHLSFIRNDFKKILTYVNKLTERCCFDSIFVGKSLDNQDAWSAYHIAEGFYYSNNTPMAVKWFQRAVELAPFVLDFRNKLGTANASAGDLVSAKAQFNFIISENPKYVQAYTNLGYIKLLENAPQEALKIYTIAQKLAPDNEALLLNLAGYYLFVNDRVSAKKYLNQIIKKNPANQKAALALKQLNS